MNPKTAECGTYSGYMRHRRHGEFACRPCRDAANVYVKEYRAAHPSIRDSNKELSAAYGRALARLRARYRGVFERYYAEEKGTA